MSTLKDRVDALKAKTVEYVGKEKTRIQNEYSVLDKVLKKRTGGAGVQEISKAHAEEVANYDLASFLES